nr:MAG TPA: hypothetical protein [Caudoviricetes sp.]
MVCLYLIYCMMTDWTISGWLIFWWIIDLFLKD